MQTVPVGSGRIRNVLSGSEWRWQVDHFSRWLWGGWRLVVVYSREIRSGREGLPLASIVSVRSELQLRWWNAPDGRRVWGPVGHSPGSCR